MYSTIKDIQIYLTDDKLKNVGEMSFNKEQTLILNI